MNRTVIVTGASNGIGRAVAKLFATNYYNVVIADLDAENGNSLQDELLSEGRQAQFIHCDVSDPKSIQNMVKETIKRYQRIDILINNAGISEFIRPDELSVEKWDQILNTNLRASFLLTREVVPHMKKNEKGSVVNIASTRALMSEKNSEAYAASKGGLLALTHSQAVSYSEDKITVNCISPGWIHTGDYDKLRDIDHEQHPSNRVGKPDDIARACLFLADAENDFINGENIVIDGGMTRKMIYEH
ncbi:SDR family NAD(P)-dependent oxidoreductase [Rhodohalobacter barkolensis]|uniref:3-ketoacyl-ACP reductase n=1 Tax=Rhodohalobacter barkolensis TaxID=2053187 RepID=A0A2N0VL87_9BACT|nr:glucose 1-dehydrogenase [Rhodohalobacter barkolensis]PKD44963.1 3-ketoacyl-ACP reductase [Rhodohalobacter barkolensis]